MSNADKIKRIEQAWTNRAESQGYKPGSATYKKAQVEFFVGAMTAIDAFDDTPDKGSDLSRNVPPHWVLAMMSGRDVVKP